MREEKNIYFDKHLKIPINVVQEEHADECCVCRASEERLRCMYQTPNRHYHVRALHETPCSLRVH